MSARPAPFAAEPFYSIADVRSQFFASRSKRWVRQRCQAGDFGALVKDAGGWLVPRSGILAYLERNRVQAGADTQPRREQIENLIQFSKA